MLDAIKGIFEDKLLVDDREALHTFSIPGLDGEYALYAPKAALWNQLILAVLVQLGFQMIFAVVVYKLIVQNRGSVGAYLLGYGAVIPLSLYLPFSIMDFFQVHNQIVKLAFSTLPMIVVFRTIEAMHGTSPHTVESNVGTYMVYYTSVSHFEWDPKTKERRKITSREIGAALIRIFYFFTAVSLWLSFMVHVDFRPMQSNVELESFRFTLDLFSPAHLFNTYCLAVLTYFVLATGFELTTFGEQVKGYATQPIFDNPLFSSRSIREFWGRKWNLMIHRVLKHGAFLPAKEAFLEYGGTVGNIAGVVFTFLASGLLHEYCWAVIFYQYQEDGGASSVCGRVDEEGNPTCYSPIPFKLTLFFLYNAGTILLEHYFGRHITFFESWPSIVVSTLLVLTALPISHFYTGDWVASGYFSDFPIGLWHIKRVD